MPDTGFVDGKKKWPKVLTFDTSGPFVSVGWSTESYSGGTVHDMARGQAEALFPLLETQLADCRWTWEDVDVIGVAVGPGNFTGIRIGVSAARGLGLALGLPVFAINQFELVHGHSPLPAGTLISVPAPRDMSFVQGADRGGALISEGGRLIDPADPPADLQLSGGMEVVGHRATEIASHFGATGFDETYAPDPGRMAEMAEFKYLDAIAFPPRPAPQYVKAPDAAPARDPGPAILA